MRGIGGGNGTILEGTTPSRISIGNEVLVGFGLLLLLMMLLATYCCSGFDSVAAA
jgi:hypothetical protein